jgi:hypothetical protein
MKKPMKYTMLKKLTALMIAVCSIPGFGSASDSKTVSAVSLSFYKNPDQSRTAIANVMQRDKKNGVMVFAKDTKINFYLKQSSGETLIGSAFSGVNGKALLVLSKTLPVDESGSVTIEAKLENDPVLANAETEASVKDARIVLSLSEKDTLKQITAKATQLLPDGTEKPIEKAEVKFGVRRLFGIMPLGEEPSATTDENGIAVFNFPKDINGDEKGNVEIVARILDDENFGNIEAAAKKQWGLPLVVEQNPFPRAIWEPKAPLWLIIAFTTVFGAIWFTYSFVVYTISGIDKIEKKK